MNNKYLICLIMFTLLGNCIQAQISFSDGNHLLSNTNFNSGGPIGVVDVNDDGKDDIVRLDQGYLLHLEYQNESNGVFTNKYVGELNNYGNWSMCAADIHNNGYLSVWADGALANVNETGTAFDIFTLEQSSFFIQGSNFVDINNDGWLDAFACNDDGESGIWRNDGTGTLVPQNDWIDMSINGSSGEPASGNYGSIWTDFDNDGDTDLYIAKCRQGVSNPNDERRINVLYVNDGLGNFTEMGEAHGLRINWQSWTADFQDINNDGWLDVFILNHDYQAQLLINDGTGHFTELENTGINVGGFPIQGVMRDFDNDGFVDVIVTGERGQIFKNNGDSTFTEILDAFTDSDNILSFGLGDLNSDGFVDVYTGYGSGFVSPSFKNDILHLNDGNDNNFAAMHLRGTISNRDGLGARIELFGEWGIQVREVRSGESYGIMNSMNQYFGLGTATEIDSMIIRWPSGLIQTEYDVPINSFVDIIEGGCLAASPEVAVEGETVFCPGDSTTLIGQAGYDSYLWSTGETTPNITVTESGNYKLTVTDDSGCYGFSSLTKIEVNPMLFPEIVTDGPLSLCEGQTISLSEINTTGISNHTWSNGATGSTIEVGSSGTYFVELAGLCQNFMSNEIVVAVDEYPVAPTASPVTVIEGEQATLTADGVNVAWYDVETGGDILFAGDTYITPPLTNATQYYAESRTGVLGITASVGQIEHAGSPFSGGGGNNRLIFDSFKPFRLDSVKVYTDIPAVRRIMVYDNSGNLVASKEVMIEFGETFINLGLEIPAGNDMYIMTDEKVNFMNLGLVGPRLQRSDDNIQFPYEVDEVISIKESNFGVFWYYYFYDWKISVAGNPCASERTEVEVTVDSDVGTFDISQTDQVSLFPNPTTDEINLELNFQLSENTNLSIYDINGRKVMEEMLVQKSNTIKLNTLPKGVYRFSIVNGTDIFQGNVVLH